MGLPLIINPEVLGDNPDAFFLDDNGRAFPFVVEHATGITRFVLVSSRLIPYDEWKAEHQRPANGAPRAMTIQSGDAAFQGELKVQ